MMAGRDRTDLPSAVRARDRFSVRGNDAIPVVLDLVTQLGPAACPSAFTDDRAKLGFVYARLLGASHDGRLHQDGRLMP
jgi:hypothetical protein